MSQSLVKDRYTHDKIVVATIVEICELANEFAAFKYWKKNHVSDKEKLLDEFADCVHFFGSLSNQTGSSKKIMARSISDDLTKQLYETIGAVHLLAKEFTADKVEKAMSLFFGLGELLQISTSDIEYAYYKKRENNLKRINGTY